MVVQFPELSIASYTKNPLSAIDPEGLVCVWNLHLLERPEFVFHAQVRTFTAVDLIQTEQCIVTTVRCPLRHVLAFPSESYNRWHLFWPNPTLGYTFPLTTGPQNTSFSIRSYTSRVLSRSPWHSKRAQSSLGFIRWDSVCLGFRHAGETF